MPLPILPSTNVFPMNFTENQLGNVVLERLRQQREMNEFCDVILVVQGDKFPAHRNILAACSPYFESILKKQKVVKEQVTVNCQNPAVFQLLLNYMYSGNVVIDRNNVYELLKLSSNFVVSKLKNYCAEYLDRYLDATNCISVKELGERYNMPGLVKNSCLFLESNINEVLVESSEVLEFSFDKTKALLCDSTYNIASTTRLRFAMRWVSYKLQDRESCFKPLLEFVHFEGLDNNFLSQILDTDPLFQRSETCLFNLLQTLNEKDMLFQKFISLYHSLLVKYSGDVSIYLNPPSQSVAQSGTSEDLIGQTFGQSRAPENLIGSQPEQPPPMDVDIFLNPDLTKEARVSDDTASKSDSLSVGQNQDYTAIFEQQKQLEEMEAVAQEAIVAQPQMSSPSAASSISGSNHLPDSESDAGSLQQEKIVPPLKIKLTGLKPMREKEKKKHKHISVKHKMYNKQKEDAPSGKKRRAKSRNDVSPSAKHRSGSLGPLSSPNTSGEIEPQDHHGDTSLPAIGDAGTNGDHASTVQAMEETELSEEDFSDDEDDDEDIEQVLAAAAAADDAMMEKAEPQHKCIFCIYKTTCAQRLETHMGKAHVKDRTFACNVCGFTCKWNRQYYAHMREHFQGPTYHCDSCDYSAERLQPLLTHRMRHTNERPYTCCDCEFKCRTRTNLVKHMRTHSGDKPFTCNECGRTFAIRSTLEQHQATHSDDRPFQCSDCNFTTKYQSHLISHKRIHTGDVFHCEYQDCTYSSPKKSQLAAHMRTHMAVRNHPCKQCGRAFIEKSHLVRHERIHLSEKPFKCEICDYASSRRDKLKEHVLKHHAPGTMARMTKSGSLGRPRRVYRRRKMLPVGGTSLPYPKRGIAARMQQMAARGTHPGATPLGAGTSTIVVHPTISVDAKRAVDSVVNPKRGLGDLTRVDKSALQPAYPSNDYANAAGFLNTMAMIPGPSSSFYDYGSQSMDDAPPPSVSHYLTNGETYHVSAQDSLDSLSKDVLLAPRDTVTPLLAPPSPAQSTTTSLLSDPLPSVHTPLGTDALQRPTSLPPFGLGGTPTPHNGWDNSYTAMF